MRQANIGGGNDKNYVKVFSNAESVIVEHNLNKYPAVKVVDTAGTEFDALVVDDSVNQCTVSWNGLASGKVICN